MYGLVHKAVEGLLLRDYGPEILTQVRQKAGVSGCPYARMTSYPDETTYALVGAAAEVLNVSPSQILEAFGEHWVLFTASEGYGRLLDHCGGNLREFLLNLDTLHTRVGMIFPDLRPPSFRCQVVEDGSLRLQYYSERSGLLPMIVGLLKGLSRRFETAIRIEAVAGPPKDRLQGEFLIHWV